GSPWRSVFAKGIRKQSDLRHARTPTSSARRRGRVQLQEEVMSSLRAVTCFGAAALLGLAMVTEGAVLKWSDHQASIVPPEEQSGLGGSGRSTGPVQPINLTNVDGSGINITVTATIGDRAETEEYVDSVFISGTPSY